MSKRASVTNETGTATNNRVRIGNDTTSKTLGQTRSLYGGNEGLSEWTPDQPIEWMHTSQRNWKGNNLRKGKNGIERLPSLAHVGEHDDYQQHPRAESRYRTMLKADGHEHAIVHSNAAAHLPTLNDQRWSRDGYAQQVIDKGWACGWIPKHTDDGHTYCTKRAIADKVVNPAALLKSDEFAKMPACPKDAASCKHYELEKAARRALHNAEMDAIEERTKGAEVKQLESLAKAVAMGLKAHQEGK